jgi:hypothetical protein
MFLPTGKKAAAAPSTFESSLRIHRPEDVVLSPSIQQVAGEKIAAFEVKFLLRDDVARHVQQWAMTRMEPDAYADPRQGGAYQTTSLYLDTPQRDVFHRGAGHRRRKFRLRRYGLEARIYLERKTRRGDRVAKRRCDVPLDELAALTGPAILDTWPGDWFRTRIHAADLRPACRITYDRTAFMLRTDDGPLRLTLDRSIRGLSTDAWDLTPITPEHPILTDHVVCEFKFRGALPNLFKELIYALKLESGSFSKYRRMMVANGESIPLQSSPLAPREEIISRSETPTMTGQNGHVAPPGDLLTPSGAPDLKQPNCLEPARLLAGGKPLLDEGRSNA